MSGGDARFNPNRNSLPSRSGSYSQSIKPGQEFCQPRFPGTLAVQNNAAGLSIRNATGSRSPPQYYGNTSLVQGNRFPMSGSNMTKAGTHLGQRAGLMGSASQNLQFVSGDCTTPVQGRVEIIIEKFLSRIES